MLAGTMRHFATMSAVVFLACFHVVPEAIAQHLPIEYMMRIPKYYRLKGGSSQFAYDQTRGALLFDGGPYDTYVTYDRGDTWETIFDTKMFFIDVQTTWRMDDVGNWYYQGNVYNKVTLNLVTEDAGKTIRYLIADTAMVENAREWEAPVTVVPPRGVYMQVGRGPNLERHGTYSSCDAGRTWTFLPFENGSTGFAAPAGPNTIRYQKQGIPTWLEYNVCDGSFDTLALTASEYYKRLSDGTTLQWGLHAPPRMNVTRPNASTPVTYSMYPDAETGIDRTFTPGEVWVVNDTLALIIAAGGVIATLGEKSDLRFIDIPPFRDTYQRVWDYGTYGDRILLRTAMPSASSDSTCRYTLFNTRTGEHRTIVHPGPTGNQNAVAQRIMPYTDSMWIASFEAGELMITRDAGATWTMVDNISRDERWGMTYVGVNRLFDRGDGSMSVLTERNRLMVQDSATKKWFVAHLGPFAHRINNPYFWDPFTYSTVHLAEDVGGRYRSRFGPSTAYFHTPDSLWITGDVVTRWTPKGEFIDTVLQRRARVLKRVTPDLVVAAMDSVWFTFSNGRAWTYISEHWPKHVNGTDTTRAALGDIVSADNKDLIVGLRGMQIYDTLDVLVDSIPGGLMRSADSGVTWSRSTSGIPEHLYVSSLLKLQTGTILCLALEVALDPRIITPGGMYRLALEECKREQFRLGYGYIYRSADDGRTWTQVHTFSSREFLPAVDPRIILMPDGRPMAIHPDVGIAISPNDGNWFSVGDPLYVGNPNISDVVFTDDGYAHFATDSGYLRIPLDRIMDVREERQSVGSLSTYVNAAGMLTISNTEFVPQTIRVLSLDGRTAKHGSNVNGITELDVADLAHGTYVVTASSATELRSALIQIY